uniref:Uncharacterized protein n=1 Tax=Knipowitschia caucasica TaxID=637954 RepID=A0AAV2MH48_KNICA
MKDLLDLFVKTVQKEEAISLEDFRADQLKYYLRQDFPQLHFHKSPKRNTSEMVFSGFLGASDGLEQTPCGPTSSTESSNSEQKTESGPSGQSSTDPSLGGSPSACLHLAFRCWNHFCNRHRSEVRGRRSGQKGNV